MSFPAIATSYVEPQETINWQISYSVHYDYGPGSGASPMEARGKCLTNSLFPTGVVTESEPPGEDGGDGEGSLTDWTVIYAGSFGTRKCFSHAITDVDRAVEATHGGDSYACENVTGSQGLGVLEFHATETIKGVASHVTSFWSCQPGTCTTDDLLESEGHRSVSIIPCVEKVSKATVFT